MIKLDTMGKDCPLPLIELKKAVAASQKGEEIEIAFTCPEAVTTLPRYCQEDGHEVLSFEKLGNKGWKMVIRN